MTMTNQVKIKLIGSRVLIEHTLEKLKSLYPLMVVGDFQPNDRDKNFHVFVTVPEEV